MCGDYLAEPLGGGHRLSHHFVILNAFSVVGERADFVGHSFHVCELFAFFADGYRAVGQNFYRRAALYRVQLNLQMFRAVRHGVEVRHRADRRVSSVRRGRRAGCNGFFIRKTRLSEMHVNITKTGDNNIIFNSGQKTPVGKELFRKGSYFFVSASEVVRHFLRLL